MRWAQLGGMQAAMRYSWPQCRYCGRAQSEDCRPATCMLCGTTQCFGNGGGNGCCAVCRHGWIPGWSGNSGKCGYKDCHEPAVGEARKRHVCRTHAERIKVHRGMTLTEYVRERIAHRDSGKGWEQWREVA